MRYRREVDGLRAVAVIPVILFHAGVEVFAGGFVGVDIFFVISGYLITSILISELEQGQFSILQFYERRARRILPALYFVMLSCIPFAWAWMLPAQLKDFAESLAAVSIFIPNLLFWRESGYFAAATELKPLIHTWSLAVEEQYYLVFPIVLYCLWRVGRRAALWVVIGVATMSLAWCEWSWRNEPNANFFLATTRAWELLGGSICAFLCVGREQRSSELLSATGLVLITFSVFYFDERIPFPSLYTLTPILGTSLVILFAGSETWTARILSTRVLVGVGLISYSTYLWHQPLIAFARIRSEFELEQWEIVFIASFSIVLGYFTWQFVERPFRRKPVPLLSNRFALAGTSVAMAVFFLMFGIIGHVKGGFIERYNYAADFIRYFENSYPKRAYFKRIGLPAVYREECNFYVRRQSRLDISKTCFSRDLSIKHSVLIWGDSHAAMLQYGIKKEIPADWQLLQITTYSCSPGLRWESERKEHCRRSNALAVNIIPEIKPDAVVLGNAEMWNRNELKEIVSWLAALGVPKIVVTGPSPRWVNGLPSVLVRHWSTLPRHTKAGLQHRYFQYDREMTELFQDGEFPGATYVSILDILCMQDGCLTYVGEDVKAGITSWDSNHLTPIASLIVARTGLVQAITSGF